MPGTNVAYRATRKPLALATAAISGLGQVCCPIFLPGCYGMPVLVLTQRVILLVLSSYTRAVRCRY
eukprot:3017130-Rhodomonas_salina.3